MKRENLKKKKELCEVLAVNFDEANELFGSETLSSMKMARVNGGADGLTLKEALKLLGYIISYGPVGGAVFFAVRWLDNTGTKTSDMSGDEQSFFMKNGSTIIEIKLPNGTHQVESVVTVGADGSRTNVYFFNTDKPTGTNP